jgi:hypothetical protein
MHRLFPPNGPWGGGGLVGEVLRRRADGVQSNVDWMRSCVTPILAFPFDGGRNREAKEVGRV